MDLPAIKAMPVSQLAAGDCGPYCEMFSCAQRPGWDSWGDQTNKFTSG
jgi:N6-adenosine-specific RNA methylase IME4